MPVPKEFNRVNPSERDLNFAVALAARNVADPDTPAFTLTLSHTEFVMLLRHARAAATSYKGFTGDNPLEVISKAVHTPQYIQDIQEAAAASLYQKTLQALYAVIEK